ncbi:MAG TPA: hypothetical protein VNH21_04835 [Steroidobacteraceae bacterium]|nr:hypothetical protein [Steroidobacteraceae bacterium]
MLTRADGHPIVVVPVAGYLRKLHGRLRARMPMWVIYRPTTREYPGLWVARMHVTLPYAKPTRFVMTHNTLAELREMLPPGSECLARDRCDAPEIEEIWL